MGFHCIACSYQLKSEVYAIPTYFYVSHRPTDPVFRRFAKEKKYINENDVDSSLRMITITVWKCQILFLPCR